MPYKFLKKREYQGTIEELRVKKSELKEACFIVDKLNAGDLSFDDTFAKNADSAILNSLNNLKDNLLDIQKEESQRKWGFEGSSIFSELQKKNTDNIEKYAIEFVSALVKFLNANQAGVFIRSTFENTPCLSLAASYAYNKEKLNKKYIFFGEGLLGQCYLDKKRMYYTDIPKDYSFISSGLGESTPKYLLIVPAKVLEEVYAVFEMASFTEIEDYKIIFIEKIAELFAYSVKNILSQEQTLQLLKESQLLSQDLKSRDEEMRQNLEEMTATQEEMLRRQLELDTKSNILSLTIDAIPFPIFIKNRFGYYTMANRAQADVLMLKKEELIGKRDDDFVKNIIELEEIHKTDNLVIETEKELELPLQHFSLPNGKRFIFKTTKIPFKDTLTNEISVLGISVDITEQISTEKRIENEKKIAVNNVAIDVAGRQRMLSQKIAFLSELVVKGNKSKIEPLSLAVNLFEHSLSVLRKGGIPNNMPNQQEINKADEELLLIINAIEELWKEIKNSVFSIISIEASENSIRESISYIEENAEKLLVLSDKLVKAYSEIGKKNILEN